MELNDEIIENFSVKTLLSQEAIYSVFEEEDEAERTRLITLMTMRAKELGFEKDFRKTIRAFNKADKELAKEYTRINAMNKANIQLKFDSYGKPINSTENFLMILREDEYFRNIKYNLLTYAPEIEENQKCRRWTDTDDSIAREYIETKYHIHSQSKLEDALRILFKERSYHPIKNIIESVEWDGEERIPTFLTKWMKCEDSEYSREVSRLIFAGGINRLYNPGCKFDDVPILIGTKQGEGKSTFVRWLALKDEFFSVVSEIEGQKGIEALEGAWICEIAELLALTKAKEVEAVKSYITTQSDKYRKPFDKRTSEIKRQCIFIGTTNRAQFLTDKTGNRRFYPLQVHQCGYDLFNSEEEIKEDILQCWAEAKIKFDKGEMKPYADRNLTKVFREHQKEAVEDDYRVGMIEVYLENKERVCIHELWQKALKNEFTKPTRKESNEILLIMQSMEEWEKGKQSEYFREYGPQIPWKRIKNKKLEEVMETLDDGILPF